MANETVKDPDVQAPPVQERAGAVRTRLYAFLLSGLVSLVAVGGAATTYFIGRNSSRDAYVEKTGALLAAETGLTSLYDAYRAYGKEELENPVSIEALAKIYELPVRTREALVERLRTIAWFPPYRIAPFVGHIARPMLGSEPHINFLGFRDERDSYVGKPDRVVRIFVTGASNAWGSGAASQKNTISYLLEQMLNERTTPVTGYRYEVVNAAFPAWTTTQEKILIQQRLVDMGPDAVLMFSGNGDVHWSLLGRDIRWFNSVPDQNYATLLNELYTSSGHPEWAFPFPRAASPVGCSELAQITRRNVEDAAFASARVNARLIFVLIPNITSTAKTLSEHERLILGGQNKPHWDACFDAFRTGLRQIAAANYRFLDLSRAYGGLGAETEVFIDVYHVADFGNRLMAEALFAQIDWASIVPNAMPVAPAEPLKILDFEPREGNAGRTFNAQRDGSSALRLTPSRISENLVVVFDQSILPTAVSGKSLVASVSAGRQLTAGPHALYVSDRVTGERSDPVTFYAR